MAEAPSNKVAIIKNIYLYLVSLIGLLMIVFPLADVINITLRTFIFTQADQNYYGYYPEPACPVDASTSTVKDRGLCISPEEREKIDKRNATAQKQRDLVRDLSFVIVGIPLFLYHWRVIRNKEI